MTAEQKQIPTKEQLESVIWNDAAKKTLSKVYDVWDKVENINRLELKPTVKELEYIVAENITKRFGNDRFLLSLTHTYISMKMNADGKDEKLRLFIKDCMEPEHLHIELSNLRYGTSPDLPEECSILAKEILAGPLTLKGKFPEHFGIRNFQEIAQQYHDGLSRLEKQAEEYGIPLPYQNKELPGDRKPAIRLNPADISPDEQIRLAQNDSYHRWYATRKAVENRMISIGEIKIVDGQPKSTGYNFVSDSLQTEHNNIFRKEASDLLERPLVDKKWQRDWGDWGDILENYHEQGGTFASSKSAVDTDIIDKKTGKPEKRKITKEQIDAKHDPYLNAMCFMVRQLKPNNKILGNAGRRDMDKIGYYENPETHERFIKIEKYKLTKEQLKPNYESFNPLVRSIIDEFRQLIKNNPDIEDLYIRFREKERAHRAARSVDLHDVLSEAA